MSLEIILIGIIVGIANFASRFGPLYLIEKRNKSESRNSPVWLGIALGSIGIAAITSMLVVATLPPLIEMPNHHQRIAFVVQLTLQTDPILQNYSYSSPFIISINGFQRSIEASTFSIEN